MLTISKTLSYYKREDIRKAIVEGAKDKEVTIHATCWCLRGCSTMTRGKAPLGKFWRCLAKEKDK